jgi:hypothetical protein
LPVKLSTKRDGEEVNVGDIGDAVDDAPAKKR